MTTFHIPMPGPLELAKPLHNLILLGSLPPRVRALYRLTYTPAHAAGFALAVRAVRGGRRLAPPALARGANTHFFAGVAGAERWRAKAGLRTTTVPTGRPVPSLRPWWKLL